MLESKIPPVQQAKQLKNREAMRTRLITGPFFFDSAEDWQSINGLGTSDEAREELPDVLMCAPRKNGEAPRCTLADLPL